MIGRRELLGCDSHVSMTLMDRLAGYRKDLRRRYPVVVRACCERCGRVVGECYGDSDRTLCACWRL